MRQAHALKTFLPELARRQKPSALVRLLKDMDDAALFVVWAAADSKLAARQIHRYVCKLRGVRPELDGKYLQIAGHASRGRRWAASSMRCAMRCSTARSSTREEQEAFVRERLGVERGG